MAPKCYMLDKPVDAEWVSVADRLRHHGQLIVRWNDQIGGGVEANRRHGIGSHRGTAAYSKCFVPVTGIDGYEKRSILSSGRDGATIAWGLILGRVG